MSENKTIYLRNTDYNSVFKFTKMMDNPLCYKAYVSEHKKNIFHDVKYVVSYNRAKGFTGFGTCFKYYKTYEIKSLIRENGVWKSTQKKENYLSTFGDDSDYRKHVEDNIPWIWDLQEIETERDKFYQIFVKFPKRRSPYWFSSEPEVVKVVEKRPSPNNDRRYRIYKITFLNGKSYIGKDFEKNNKYSHYMGSYDRKYVIEDLEKTGFPQSKFPIPWVDKKILWENDLEYCDSTGIHFGILEDFFIKKFKTNQKEFGYNQTGRKKI